MENELIEEILSNTNTIIKYELFLKKYSIRMTEGTLDFNITKETFNGIIDLVNQLNLEKVEIQKLFLDSLGNLEIKDLSIILNKYKKLEDDSKKFLNDIIKESLFILKEHKFKNYIYSNISLILIECLNENFLKTKNSDINLEKINILSFVSYMKAMDRYSINRYSSISDYFIKDSNSNNMRAKEIILNLQIFEKDSINKWKIIKEKNLIQSQIGTQDFINNHNNKNKI